MSDRAESPNTVTVSPAESQAKYQVRFDIGVGGVERIGHVDVLVWVDSLGLADHDIPAASPAGAVIAADLTNRSAAAAWVLAHQVRLGRRVSIAVVAAGRDGSFSAADVLAAGAVVDALVTIGIDFTSPEAAVACASFVNLKNAVAHLFTASVDGQALIADGERDRVVAAATVDASDDVRVLKS